MASDTDRIVEVLERIEVLLERIHLAVSLSDESKGDNG